MNFSHIVHVGLVNTISQLLMNWPFWRGYFGSLGCAVIAIAVLEVVVVERLNKSECRIGHQWQFDCLL